MPNSLGRFKAVLGAGWVLLGLAAVIYARMKSIPAWIAVPVAAAFLIEFPFYLLPGFEAPRRRLAETGKNNAAAILTLTAVLPWLVYSIPTGGFRAEAFGLLTAIAAVVSFWYAVLPPSPLTDAAFLVVPASAVLSGVFNFIYPSPIPRAPLTVLGMAMLVRTAALAVLVLRNSVRVEYRFIPNAREWRIGAAFFVLELPFVAAAYWALHLEEWRPHPYNILLAAGTFAGILWFTSLSEEFFFRGLLQQWLGDWTRKPLAALLIASVLFGSAHLGFNHKFPNWRFSMVAAIAGLFYGLAWQRAKSIQASMVTHALTVTLWRVFFL